MLSLLQVTLDFENAAQSADLTGAENTFPELVGTVIGAIMVIGALLVLMYFVWGAMEWITAGGDSSKIEKARTRITQSIIGIIILSMTFAFFFALQQFLGIEIFTQGRSSSSSSSSSKSSSGSRLPFSNGPVNTSGLGRKTSTNNNKQTSPSQITAP